MRNIFVFGSNLAGRHGAGAALQAVRHWGAIYGQGAGLQGNSYAIPTKDYCIRTLPLDKIKVSVSNFIKFAFMQWLKDTGLHFNVTAIGCGLAGYKPSQIAPMFSGALDLENVTLPNEFTEILIKLNQRQRLPRETVIKILDMHSKGEKKSLIAKECDVTLQRVCSVCNYYTAKE